MSVDPFWGCIVPKYKPKKNIDNQMTREKILGIKDSNKFISDWTQDQYDKREKCKQEPNNKLKELLDRLLMPPPVSK